MHAIIIEVDLMDNISVIIRAKNEERWIGHAIQSVIDHISVPEIVIVDNLSSDDTLHIVRNFQQDPELKDNNQRYTEIKIVTIDDYSPGKAINRGIKNCSFDYVLIISSHCVLKKIKLEKHINDLKTHICVFGNQIPIYHGKKITKRYLWSHFKDEEVINMFSEMEDRYFLHNALALYRKKTLIEFPFDEYLTTKEDRYWANNVINNKSSILYDPQMEVEHHYTDNGNTWKGVG